LHQSAREEGRSRCETGPVRGPGSEATAVRCERRGRCQSETLGSAGPVEIPVATPHLTSTSALDESTPVACLTIREDLTAILVDDGARHLRVCDYCGGRAVTMEFGLDYGPHKRQGIAANERITGVLRGPSPSGNLVLDPNRAAVRPVRDLRIDLIPGTALFGIFFTRNVVS
jgi:hypothetical protein